MGLDMYLTKRTYFMDRKKAPKVRVSHIKHISAIEEDVMYWRKANAIHQWFVDNVQDGKDDCGQYDVTLTHLKNLYRTIKEVLEDRDRAEELLPTQSGFFFGGTDYDEYYFSELERTEKELKTFLDEMEHLVLPDHQYISFRYQSSW